MIEFLTEEEAAVNNQAAFHLLHTEISENYPKGWFVGFHAGQIVAAAESRTELEQRILQIGIDVSEVLIVPAHQDDDFLWIL